MACRVQLERMLPVSLCLGPTRTQVVSKLGQHVPRKSFQARHCAKRLAKVVLQLSP